MRKIKGLKGKEWLSKNLHQMRGDNGLIRTLIFDECICKLSNDELVELINDKIPDTKLFTTEA